jgi:MFS transporter, BCD family, chlorophyll transporter
MSVVQFRGWIPRVDWTLVATRWLPFADAASPGLPLPRLLRLALFQVCVGAATALMVGTLNRVMIVELGVGAWLVASMVALPLLVAPFRALIGLRSDLHRSFLGWKRVPFIWIGTLLLFGGLAIMPFALILLSGTTSLQWWAGHVAAGAAFLLAGAGLQTAQTAGLALATDLAEPEAHPRVVALLYTMLLVGMVGASLVYGLLLADYSHTRLVQVVQGTAVVCAALNLVALWKQEPRNALRAKHAKSPTQEASFAVHWSRLASQGKVKRFLITVGLGTLAFNMQDVILEPYGGEVLGMGVGATTQLTAMMAAGALVAFAWSARLLSRGINPHRVSAMGVLLGVAGFSAVIFAEPLGSANIYRLGATLIGMGGGLFSVGTLSSAMALDGSAGAPLAADGSTQNFNGLVIGAWGAVHATCMGLAIGLGGALRDAVSAGAMAGVFGEVLQKPATGYGAVYHLELVLLFATLVALGPLVQRDAWPKAKPQRLGMADLPS